MMDSSLAGPAPANTFAAATDGMVTGEVRTVRGSM
jgi:hypothetical protein